MDCQQRHGFPKKNCVFIDEAGFNINISRNRA